MEPRHTGVVDWLALTAITLFAVPVAGMAAALAALDFTHSLAVQAATVMIVPALVVMAVASRRGLPKGIPLRLALIAALCATVLLDLGWSGVPAG